MRSSHLFILTRRLRASTRVSTQSAEYLSYSLRRGMVHRYLCAMNRASSALRGILGFTAVLLTAGCMEPLSPSRPPSPQRQAPAHLAPVAQTPPSAKPVLLVHASSSAPNAQERAYSASITTRLAGWLGAQGIPTREIDDESLAHGAWTEASVVILGCNPNPGLLELLALRRFIGRGGKVIVFYSAEPRLAALLGVRLGAYATAPPGQWAAFRFNDAAPAGTPPRIDQDSRNIRPAFPDSPGASVIAWWETLHGKRLPDPAWVRSDRGFWMSHVLLEGDGASKQAMLIALLGACDPAYWRVAAHHALTTSGTLGRFASMSEALDAVNRLALQGGQEARVLALLTQAEQLRADMEQSHRSGDDRRVVATARLLDAAMTEAYARTQTPRTGEFRGVWNHSGLGLRPGDWRETTRILSQSGMTAIFPNVCRPWTAHFESPFIPRSDFARQCGDQLLQCTEAARPSGLEVHAWVICWNLEGAPTGVLAAYRKAGRLQVSASGESLPWLCPSHPDNVAFEVNSIRDMAARYPLDGVHLDYVRYKSRDYCYCPGCRARFMKDTGRTPRRWPADVREGPMSTLWQDWRRDRITRMLVQTRAALKTVAPHTKLSAAVYTGYPGCRDSIGQDWGEWVRLGHVDFVCPMNYTRDTAKALAWYRKQAALPGCRDRLYPGIGVTATESRLDAVETLVQLGALRNEGVPGFMLFEANPTLEKDILPFLRMGATGGKP